jgi:hypothetical protein
VLAKLLPQRLLILDFLEKGVRYPGATQPLLRLRDDDVGRGQRGAGRRRLGVVHRTLTSCSRPIASPTPRVCTQGLARMAPSIGPSWGQNHHQQEPPPPRGPRRTGSLCGPIHALGGGREAPTPVRPPPPPLLAAALRPRTWHVTARPSPPRSPPPAAHSPSAALSSQTFST